MKTTQQVTNELKQTGQAFIPLSRDTRAEWSRAGVRARKAAKLSGADDFRTRRVREGQVGLSVEVFRMPIKIISERREEGFTETNHEFKALAESKGQSGWREQRGNYAR